MSAIAGASYDRRRGPPRGDALALGRSLFQVVPLTANGVVLPPAVCDHPFVVKFVAVLVALDVKEIVISRRVNSQREKHQHYGRLLPRQKHGKETSALPNLKQS